MGDESKEILTRAITQAVDNGLFRKGQIVKRITWPEYCGCKNCNSLCRRRGEIFCVDPDYDEKEEKGMEYYDLFYSVEQLLFQHPIPGQKFPEFAKAFWGDDYLYHLQQQVILPTEDEQIKYLEKGLKN